MPFLVEKLEVYRKALDFAEEIISLTESFPKGYRYVTEQINGAAISISANIAEGNGRWHKNERKQFFYYARGSAHECLPYLEICRRKDLIDSQKYSNLKNQLEEISKMITSLIKGI